MLGGQPVTAVGNRAVPHEVGTAAARERWFWHAERFLFLLLVAPNLLHFGILTFWPMVQNAYLPRCSPRPPTAAGTMHRSVSLDGALTIVHDSQRLA